MKLTILLCTFFISLHAYSIEPENSDTTEQLKKWIYERAEQVQGFEPSSNSAMIAQRFLIYYFLEIYNLDNFLEKPLDFKGVKTLTITKQFNDHTSDYTLYFDSINGLTTIDYNESIIKISYQDKLPTRMICHASPDTTTYIFRYKDCAIKIESFVENSRFKGLSRVGDENVCCGDNIDTEWNTQCYYEFYYYEDNDSEGYRIECNENNNSADADASFFDKQQMQSYHFYRAPNGHSREIFEYTNQRKIPYEKISKELFSYESQPDKSVIRQIEKDVIQAQYYRYLKPTGEFISFQKNVIEEPSGVFIPFKREILYFNSRNLPEKYEEIELDAESNHSSFYWKRFYNYTYF